MNPFGSNSLRKSVKMIGCAPSLCTFSYHETMHAQLRSQIQNLQLQLSQRPSKEHIQELEKEYNNLELILQGTQKENERCMHELEACVNDNIYVVGF
jgi:hypothetical protein